MLNTITLRLANFRSVETGEIELRPLTILTGPNGSGKSSFAYGLVFARNVVTSQQRTLDQLFDLGSLNLGGFKETVFLKQPLRAIEVGLRFETESFSTEYSIKVGSRENVLSLIQKKPLNLDLSAKVAFPYSGGPGVSTKFSYEGISGNVFWSGFAAQFSNLTAATEEAARAASLKLSTMFAAPLAALRSVDLVPLKRGFTKYLYTAVPLQDTLSTEDEVATSLLLDREAEARVSFALEKLTNKSFAARSSPAGGFYLQTVDRTTEFICDLVNEGFGLNQLVYLLARITQPSKILCIEEPENHLHPALLGRLADTLISATEKYKSRFLITSHSEQFVLRVLNRVAKKELDPARVAVYFVSKNESGRTVATDQVLNDKGQVEGGLRTFYEPAIETLRDFLSPE
jgi:hypothetical protein